MDDRAPASGQPTSESTAATDEADQLPLPARRQWWLAGLAWLLSLGAFFVPQRIPLEWYPLNEPGTDIHYLEIKCASNADGWVTLWYDITHGWSDIDQIRFPISPTEQTYTYTFPLPDAPMIGLRLDSVAKGGALTVHHMRIINRRSEEVRNFPIESLEAVQGIASIQSLPPGWVVKSTPDATTPTVLIEPFSMIQPVGMTGRNVHRCLLSTGYLAGMLVILMLAVTSAFWRPTGWCDFVGHIALLALIAVPFSAVGNRGLIRNTIRYAAYEPVERAPQPTLEITIVADRSSETQLYWDTGAGFAEEESLHRSCVRVNEPHVLRFPLPDQPLRTLRFDPARSPCAIRIVKIEVTDGRSPGGTEIPSGAFTPVNQIATLAPSPGGLLIESTADANDPYVHFEAGALETINAAAEAIRQSAAQHR